MMGGLGGNVKTTNSLNFPVAQPWALNNASQNATSEALAAAAGTAETYTRGQDYNTCQIMKYDYGVSFAKQSTFREIGGLSLAGEPVVRDELAFQKAAALQQMAVDVEFSFLQGEYEAQNLATTVAKTRGILEACDSNKVDASAATLTKDMVNEVLLDMAGNGAEFNNMVMFVNAFQRQMISDIFGYAPEDRNVGGVNIKRIETEFCDIGVVYAPYMVADDLLIADMSVCFPVFCPVDGQIIADVPIATTAAQKGGFIYAQVGLDYGPEEFHGKIYDLATS